jgi:septal ring factor EnvC (AmiA/AmiB activator)
MQIKKIQDAEQTILSGNDSLTEQRKKAYLLELLNLEQTRYTQLNQKLTQQQALNTRLQAEVDRLNKAMGSKAQQHQQLIAEKESNLKQVIAVKQQIAQEKKQLNHLKQRQAELNQLLNKLADAERKQRQQQQAAAKKAAIAAAKNNNSTTNKPTTTIVAQQPVGNSNAGSGVALGKADNSSEDNSPFMSRKLVKPISGKILVSFGQMRDSVRNNGILLSASDNTPVYAVSRGSVLFSGELPGFGQIIVIDHGDNYTSVYSGVISKIGKGSSVGAGQQIATSGVEENQPMGGVYFELRHLGKPVNPSSLF